MLYCNRCGNEMPGNMRFCTDCGAEIVRMDRTGPTPSLGAPTRPLSTAPINLQQLSPTQPVNMPENYTPQFGVPRTEHIASVTPSARSSSTARIVAITVGVMLLVFGVGGVGAWLWFRNSRSEVISSRASHVETGAPTTSSSSSNNKRPSARLETTAPATSQTDSRSNIPGITAEVVITLNEWAATTRAHDFAAHMSYYSDALDVYYGQKNVSIDVVRANRVKAFERYSTLDVQLSGIDVSLDATSTRATATFDKSWRFEGGKTFTGSVRQIVWLGKFGNRWLITGEKDSLVYRP